MIQGDTGFPPDEIDILPVADMPEFPSEHVGFSHMPFPTMDRHRNLLKATV
jgi:hypothetical protein